MTQWNKTEDGYKEPAKLFQKSVILSSPCKMPSGFGKLHNNMVAYYDEDGFASIIRVNALPDEKVKLWYERGKTSR